MQVGGRKRAAKRKEISPSKRLFKKKNVRKTNPRNLKKKIGENRREMKRRGGRGSGVVELTVSRYFWNQRGKFWGKEGTKRDTEKPLDFYEIFWFCPNILGFFNLLYQFLLVMVFRSY